MEGTGVGGTREDEPRAGKGRVWRSGGMAVKQGLAGEGEGVKKVWG